MLPNKFIGGESFGFLRRSFAEQKKMWPQPTPPEGITFSQFGPGSKGFGNNDNIADTHSLLSRLRLTGEKKKVIQELELLIIDEISMVRCDTLDAIDTVMRHIRQR